jgi:hypothetical protein
MVSALCTVFFDTASTSGLRRNASASVADIRAA